jgi:beta-N-acetylhexosaminidase
VVISDLNSLTLDTDDRQFIDHPCLGGIILFSRNFESYGQLKSLIRDVKSVRSDLLICVDHEGGRVQRFRKAFTHIPPMQSLGKFYIADPNEAISASKELGWLLASELLDVGIEHSFAPVVDLDDGKSQVIGDRSFSTDPKICVDLAEAFIGGMNSAGMASCIKHFPGHGSVVADSHLELPVDNRSIESVTSHDLEPFKRLAGMSHALMSAHIIFPNIDDQPASFSKFWLQDILRKQFDYRGLIFSDDLSMQGAVSVGSYAERSVKALDAGCDSLIVCNQRAKAREVLDAVSRYQFKRDPVSLTSLRLPRQVQTQVQTERCAHRRARAIEFTEYLWRLCRRTS